MEQWMRAKKRIGTYTAKTTRAENPIAHSAASSFSLPSLPVRGFLPDMEELCFKQFDDVRTYPCVLEDKRRKRAGNRFPSAVFSVRGPHTRCCHAIRNDSTTYHLIQLGAHAAYVGRPTNGI